MSKGGWELRPIEDEHLDLVLEIEAQSHPTAWPRSLFEGELELAWARVLGLWDGVELLGYVDYWLVHDELHVLNIAVAPRARRQGCARYMLDTIIADGVTRGVEYVTLEVRSQNEAAQRLYANMGFSEVGRRKRYYKDTGDDALVLALELEPAV